MDVTLRISGFFRDAFPNVIRLFDAAVKAVANYDDPGDLNTLKHSIQTDIRLLERSGLSHDEAERPSDMAGLWG